MKVGIVTFHRAHNYGAMLQAVAMNKLFEFRYIPNEDDEEILPISGFEIDLEDIITESIVLNVPMKWLHDEQCKGICKVCGINLNKQSCHCDAQEIDPRLEGLRNLFHPQSEE